MASCSIMHLLTISFFSMAILLGLIALSKSLPTQATQTYPSGMQCSYATIISTPTTNKFNTQSLFTTLFPNGMTISNTSNIMFAIGISGIDLDPVNSTGDFYCHPYSPTGLAATTIAFACAITNSFIIKKQTYRYIVVDLGFFTTLTNSNSFLLKSTSLNIGITGANITYNITKQFGGSTAMPSSNFDNIKCLIFIRGFTYMILNEQFNQINASCYSISNSYSIRLIISPYFSAYVRFTIVGFDINQVIWLRILEFSMESFLTQIAQSLIINFNQNVFAFMFGLKSFTLTKNIRHDFEIRLESGSGANNLFPRLYNEVQYFALSEIRCNQNEYVQLLSRTCKVGRNECSPYYQYFSNEGSRVNDIQIQQQLKIMAVSSESWLKIYRYNGTNYILYQEILIGVIEFKATPDFSKIVVLSSTGLYVFAWNGTIYLNEYILALQIEFLTYQKLGIGLDFNTILFSYRVETQYTFGNVGRVLRRQYICTVTRDTKTGNYSRVISQLSSTQSIYFSGLNRALITTSTSMYEMSFSQLSKTFIRVSPIINLNTNTYNQSFFTALSGDNQVLATFSVQTSHTLYQYITIWQRDPITKLLAYHSTIYKIQLKRIIQLY